MRTKIMFKGLILCFAVIVASHIRLRAMITVLHRDAEHRGEGRDDHRSRPMYEATMTQNT